MVHAVFLGLAAVAAGALLPGGPFTPIGAVLLGVVLAVNLRLYEAVQSDARLGAVILAAVAGYFAQTFVMIGGVILGLALSPPGDVMLSATMALAGGVGAAIIAVVYLQALPSARGQLGLEVAACAVTGALVVFLWELGVVERLRWLTQLPLWNGAVAGTLGLVAHFRSRPEAEGRMVLRALSGAGLAGVCGMLAFGGDLRAAVRGRRPS